MSDKMKVKVVKKSDKSTPAVKRPSAAKATRLAAREMVNNVSDWVSEFKARRAKESRVAFDTFFPKHPTPSES